MDSFCVALNLIAISVQIYFATGELKEIKDILKKKADGEK